MTSRVPLVSRANRWVTSCPALRILQLVNVTLLLPASNWLPVTAASTVYPSGRPETESVSLLAVSAVPSYGFVAEASTVTVSANVTVRVPVSHFTLVNQSFTSFSVSSSV